MASKSDGAEVTLLTGTWQHDLDQVNLLPADKVRAFDNLSPRSDFCFNGR